MRQTILAALLGAAILSGCGGGGSTADTGADAAEPAAEQAAIKIADFVYEPATARVAAGAPIEISNTDAAPHTVTDTGAGKAFDSGTIEAKRSATLTIDEPGTYRYICEFHPFMKGEITVTK